jgi:diguanylate cyclase (GGDEF)-like protein
VISLRKEVEESELFATSFAALVHAFKGVTTAVSATALPANPGLAQECSHTLEMATGRLDGRPAIKAIEEAGNVAIRQVEQICCSNRAALEERDAAVKEVVSMVAAAVGSLKGNGETRKSHLTLLADEFDVLSHFEDPAELRRRLSQGVENLRRSVEQMRQEDEASVCQFESHMAAFQQRLEKARKDSETDRLTGLGSRLAASRHLSTLAAGSQVHFQLFDIEEFGEINRQHGTLFGDRLLKALAHLLATKVDEQGALFRWGADEFLVIAQGPLPSLIGQCEDVRLSFANGRYITVLDGVKVALTADLAFGTAQYKPGEGIEQVYRRARRDLEQNRMRWWRQ